MTVGNSTLVLSARSALTVSAGQLCLAAEGIQPNGTVRPFTYHVSTNGGRTWNALDNSAIGLPADCFLCCVGGRFFIIGRGYLNGEDQLGQTWTSTDLVTFTRINRRLNPYFGAADQTIVFAGGYFWCLNQKDYGYTGPGDLDPEHSNTVLRSADGVNWSVVVLMSSTWGTSGDYMDRGLFTINDRVYVAVEWNAQYSSLTYARIYEVTGNRLSLVAELEDAKGQEMQIGNTAMTTLRATSGRTPAYFFNGSGWETPGNVVYYGYNYSGCGLYQGETFALMCMYGTVFRKESGGSWVTVRELDQYNQTLLTRPQAAIDGNLYSVFGTDRYPPVVSTDQGRTWNNITDILGSFTKITLTAAGVLYNIDDGTYLYELAEQNTDAPAFWQAFLVSYETAGSLVDTPPTSGGGDPGTGTPDPGAGTGTVWYTDDFEQSSPLQGGWSFTNEWASTGQYSLRTPRLTREGSADFGLYVKMDEPGTLTLDYRMVNGFIRSNLNNVTQPEVSADGVKTGTYTLALPAGDCLISIAYWGGSFGTLPEGTEYRFAMDNLRITGKGTMVQVGSAGYQGAEEENTGGGTTPGTGTGTSPSTPPSGAWYADDFEGASPMAGEWTYDTSWYTKGTRSLRSKAITHSQSTSVGFDFTMTTAGELSFDYKVSSENNFDWLTIYLNGSQFERYSFEVNGTAKIPVGVGNHSLQITYSKDSSSSSGADSAWIDNLVITGAGSITAYTGTQPATGGDSGSGGSDGGTTPAPAWYTDDFEGSSPMQGGWSFDNTWSSTGTQSLRSKTISDSQTTSVGMKFTMTEAGTVTLDYKVSSEASYDYLQIMLDGQQKYLLGGELTGTATMPVTAGAHTLQVVYLKDSSAKSGSDCAWIDNLRITGGGSITGYTAEGADVAVTPS